MIHEELEVPEDIRSKILAFVHDNKDGFMLLFKKETESFLYGVIHKGLSSAGIQPKLGAQLTVERQV